eukprot:scaffold44278_cov221-Amphora_coffeaeformis.AAC.2
MGVPTFKPVKSTTPTRLQCCGSRFGMGFVNSPKLGGQKGFGPFLLRYYDGLHWFKYHPWPNRCFEEGDDEEEYMVKLYTIPGTHGARKLLAIEGMKHRFYLHDKRVAGFDCDEVESKYQFKCWIDGDEDVSLLGRNWWPRMEAYILLKLVPVPGGNKDEAQKLCSAVQKFRQQGTSPLKAPRK